MPDLRGQVTGQRLGRRGEDVVQLLLNSPKGLQFTSLPCVSVVDEVQVRCSSPPGVGTVVSAVIAVDGIQSDAYPTPGLMYSAPVVLQVEALSGSTAGGIVYITGRNFGPASLNAVGAVTYYPASFAIDPRPAACNVTLDDVQLTCVSSGGVGAQV